MRFRQLSFLIVALFAYANLLCVSGGAVLESCDDHTNNDCEPAHHDHDAPAQPSKDCSKDSCFCSTMNAVTSPPTIVKPDTARLIRLLDLSLPVIQNTIPKVATVAC